jgi:PAS domain S-box-containing protein
MMQYLITPGAETDAMVTDEATATAGAGSEQREPRASFLRTADSAAAAREEQVLSQPAVQQILLDRLASERPTAEFMHIALIAILCATFWGDASTLALGYWFYAVVTATATRVFVRRWVRHNQPDLTYAIRLVRTAVVTTGLAWAVGPATVTIGLPFGQVALVVVAFVGLVAGASTTIVADPKSFYGQTIALIVPLTVSIAVYAKTIYEYSAVLLIVLFGIVISVLYGRSHRALLRHITTAAKLSVSEKRMRQERGFLEALLRSAPTAFVAMSSEGIVLGANPAFEGLFGYAPDEAIGRHLNDLIVPESEEETSRQLEGEVLAGKTVTAEVPRRRKNGTLVWVRVAAAPVEDGDRGTWFVLYHDITDIKRAESVLRQAEQQYRELVESASDVVWQVDRQGCWSFMNAASRGVYGREPRDMVGQPLADVVAPEYLDRDLAAFRDVLKGEALEDYETVHQHADGSMRHLSFSAHPVQDDAGEVVGARGITRDVTDRVAAREAVERARQLAERAAEAKAAFLANMSHEIRTPMNGVLGMTELLLRTDLDAEQRQSVELVQSSAESLLRVIDDILDFSRIESGELVLEDIPFDLHAMIQSVVRLLAVRAFEKDVELLLDIGPRVPKRVRADPGRMRQVLTNLVGNAIKFTSEGEVIVTVRAGASNGRQEIRLAVRDTGIGIPEEKLETIFDEFTQADVSTTRRFGGTGLGLAICRRIVEVMDGDLSVKSEEGRGSEFSFTASVLPEGDEKPTTLVRNRAVLHNTRVLVVDDNETNRRIMRAMLEGVEAVVSEVESADDALQLMQQAHQGGAPFALVLVDAYMPDVDGFELARRVQQDEALATTPLMMVTSVGQRGDAQRCRELGIRGYITKPVSGPEVVEMAAALLAGPDEIADTDLVTRYTIQENRRGLRILLAEDNVVNQEVAAGLLRRRGHEVEIVPDGKAAVEAATDQRFDIILMDLQMPVCDGLSATRQIRALPGGEAIPIIAMSAHVLEEEKERAREAGMNDYLVKPFKPHDLFALVEGWEQQGEAASQVPGPQASPQPVDLTGFREIMREAGAAEEAENLLAMFLADAPSRMKAIEQAAGTDDPGEVSQAAHAYKSAAGSIKATRLYELLQDLESAGREGDGVRLSALLSEVQAEHGAVVGFLQAVLHPQ